MKKAVTIITAILVVSMFASISFAEGQQGSDMQNDSVGENQEPMLISHQYKIENREQLQTMLQQREQEFDEETRNYGQAKKLTYENQNQVRLAVHALLGMENITGGIGSQVSAVARQFNNSLQNTLRAEEKIQERNAFVKFFIGGDQEAAEELEQEMNQNRQRIQELKQLKEQCDCEEGVKNMFQEQIQNMEQEQNRLEQLAQEEKQNRGIFGWLFQ